jgi:transcriptional regulator with XRE-family HTH domain
VQLSHEYSASPAGRQLGSELRRFRVAAGLAGKAAACRMGWSPSKVSRIERACTPARPGDVRALLRLYKVPGDQQRAILGLAQKAWEGRCQPVTGIFETAEVLAWAPLSVPPLLRTAGYHAAVQQTLQVITAVTPGEVARAVSRNALWQARLQGDDPVRVRAVLDESALRRQFGSAAVMAFQMQHLAGLGRQGNVELLVLRFEACGPSWLPPYTYARFTDFSGLAAPDEAEVAVLAEGPWRPGSEHGSWLHYLAFERLAALAEPAAEYLCEAYRFWSAGT